jgi:hypothetical protein
MNTTYRLLGQAVIDQLGDGALEELEEVARHGADYGVPGFTWYADTVKFFEDNRTEIVDLVQEYARDAGMGLVEYIASFNCLKMDANNPEDVAEIGRALDGRLNEDDTSVPNALAWFALERMADYILENKWEFDLPED